MMRAGFSFLALLAWMALPSSPAGAQIALSQVIVDFQTGKDPRQDVEVWNKATDRAYVAVEPAEIVNPGTPSETRRSDPDPEKLGLLVSPARMILEGGERKLLRIAEIGAPADRERVYRVTVKPVVGPVTSAQSGLKVLVGYDMLVLVRPTHPRPNVTFSRSADSGTFRNDGNVSVELFDGRQCDVSEKTCTELPGKRLYAGAQWTVPLLPGRHPEYEMESPGQSVHKSF